MGGVLPNRLLLIHNGVMGTGGHHARAEAQGTREASTLLLILVLLHRNHPRAMSTYEIGLAITDDKEPPRPLSVLVKTLTKDKYIKRAGLIGKRAGEWCITERGIQSLERRSDEASRAGIWLDSNPNYSDDEKCVMTALLADGPQAPSRLAVVCGMMQSPIRTALKRLEIRGLVEHIAAVDSRYALTPRGRSCAEEIAVEAEQTETA